MNMSDALLTKNQLKYIKWEVEALAVTASSLLGYDATSFAHLHLGILSFFSVWDS